MNSSPASDAEGDADPNGGVPAYAYKPNLVGASWEFSLQALGIEWQYGRRSGLVRYDQIQRVRMSYRPATLQNHRFITEIWSPQGPKLQVSSTSFRSLMEQARQDAPYTQFITELHRRLAAAGSAARFESGMHPVLYWLGVAVFSVIGVVLCGFLARLLANRDITGAAVILGVMLLFLWQVGTIFHRNRPLTYRPDAPPPFVLPRVKS